MSEFEKQEPLPAVTRRVEITGMVGTVPVKVSAVMAPPEPSVGLMRPYTLAIDVRHLSEGHVIPISRAERALFLGVLQSAYEILEAASG